MPRAFLLILLTLPLVTNVTFSNATAYQETVVYICPMHPEVQSSTAGLCPKCQMKLVVEEARKKNKAEEEKAEAYTCPMHLEIRTAAPGKCPKCDMPLVAANPAISEEFGLRMESAPAQPKAGEKVRLQFLLTDPRTGQQVKQFQVMHDKLFHLFIISQDMKQFQHIHPAVQPDGSFVIETVLPNPGNYKVYCDVYPLEGVPQVIQRNLNTAGYTPDLLGASARLAPDATLTKVGEILKVAPENAEKLGVDLAQLPSGAVNSIKVELQLEPAEIIAGRPVTLKYNLTDAKTGEAVRDLAPYLSAWGHTLILSEDQSDYVHSHPVETVPADVERAQLRGGPSVTFEALFPRPGSYRIWTQFLRGNAIITVSYNVKAKRLQ
ncbi:MAG TPA: heavy metal-binding domain-containing protein [Blastocatellia bacterium]|nr:heavy metal-binding domain-containing protein [Blastocatellia bacterium]